MIDAARRAGLGLALAALSGCTLITDSFLTNEFSGDPFPVHIENSDGAIIVGLRQATRPDREVVLDLLSPITLADPGFMTAPSVSYADLTLLGADGPGGALIRPRARFPDAQLVSVHPCEDQCSADDPSCDPAQCYVGARDGSPTGRRPFDGIIGADVLAGDAVRLRLGDDQLFILPDVGGSNRGRSLSCEAVFTSPYRGGGTGVVGGTELAFGGRRITLRACLGAGADPRVGPVDTDVDDVSTLRPRGSDALFVMSTGVGTSIINETAYQRYLFAHPETAAPARTPGMVYLPSGPVHGDLVRIAGITLVASASSNPLSPCRQVYAHRLLTARGRIDQRLCAPDGQLADNVNLFDCVCKNDSDFCDAPAMLALEPDDPLVGIEVLVVPDTDQTLQALRTELRPDQAEVDGLLGTDVLRTAEIDVDYPHDRLIARCTAAPCTARPQLAKDEDRLQIRSCVRGQPTGPTRPE